LIDEFLEPGAWESEEPPDAELMSELAGELDRVRIDANGGDPEARETLKAVRDKIDHAARRNEIHPAALIVLGRLFAGSQVDIGDGARALMERYVAAGLFRCPGDESYPALVQPLLRDLGSDPFRAHSEIRSLIAIFPLTYRAALVEALTGDKDQLAVQAALGFLLDPDEKLALAAIRGFGALAARGALDAGSRRRIDMMRAWLAPALRDALNEAIPPAEDGLPARVGSNVVRATASACDGSGAAAQFLTMKRGSRYSMVSLMAKPQGLVECLVIEDAPGRGVRALQQSAAQATSVSEVPLATWTKLLRLALGRNVASGAPPPFELVRALELAGVDSLAPDLATTVELLDAALAGTGEGANAEAIADAHEAVVESDAADSWFEAGEAVEAVLSGAESVEEGAQALLEGYLKGRRTFWATQCALSALALEDASASGGQRPADFAVVGREILREIPLADIPLMRQIANRSATVFFARP
jgi:hypothetical protein